MISVVGSELQVGDMLYGVEGCRSVMRVTKIDPYTGVLGFLCGTAVLESMGEDVVKKVKIPVERGLEYAVDRLKKISVADLRVGLKIEYSQGKFGVICKIEKYNGILKFLYGVATLKLYDANGRFVGHFQLPLEESASFNSCQ